MAGTYDLSTVVSRSYIPEQLQDNMQKGTEEKNAFFMQQYVKDTEKKNKSVRRADNVENPTITNNRQIKEEEKRKQKKRQKNINQNKNTDEDNEHISSSSKIDFKV